MNTRWNKAALLFLLAALPAAGPAPPVRVAVVPPENRTGDTGLDYLSDLIFNRLALELRGRPGLELYERSRADLLFRERRLAPELLSETRPSLPVDLVVGGEVRAGPEGEGGSVELRVLRPAETGPEISGRREVSSFEPGELFPAVAGLVRESLAGPLGWEEAAEVPGEDPIPGRRVAVIGFNNYSPRTGYDPLQKGIISLIEERLGRDPALELLDRESLREISREVSLAGALGAGRPDLKLPAADLLVSGYFTFSGDDFILGARIIEVPTTRIAAVFSRRSPSAGAAGEVRGLVEEIAGRLAGGRAVPAPPAGIYPATAEALLYYARGAELYDRGEYLAAVEEINRAVAVDPGHIFGAYQAGRIYEEYLKLPGRAAGAYRQVLAAGGDPALREKTRLRLGMLAFRRLDDPAGAAGLFQEFLEEFPGSPYRGAVFGALGDCRRRLGDDLAAMEAYRRALEIPGFNPLRGSLLVRAAGCLYRLEDYPGSREYLLRAREEHGREFYSAETGARPVTVAEAAERYLSRMEE